MMRLRASESPESETLPSHTHLTCIQATIPCDQLMLWVRASEPSLSPYTSAPLHPRTSAPLHLCASAPLLQVCGKDSLGAEDLLSCFDFAPRGDGAAGDLVAGYLREVVGSELDEQQRRQLLRWATSRSTLPANGIEQKVTLIRKISCGIPDQCLPEAYTCSLEVALPDYSSSDVLSKQLACALKEMDAARGGFGRL